MTQMSTETVTPTPSTLSDELALIDAYWRAANYLSVGQIYLLDNPLLTEPLAPEHIKPRLLGHWGTTPGLNLIYAHLNRIIRERDADVIYITGPGPRRPGAGRQRLARGHLQRGLPGIGEDTDGLRKLFRQFSFPGGIPSHVAPETPGSIHEGGELGYALAHAYGAAFDNPDLVVACVVGDGEAETGPLAASWHSNKFLDPVTRRRGAADPAPQRLQDRQPDRAGPHPARRNWSRCCAATATGRSRSPATTRRSCTSSWPPRWTTAFDQIAAIQQAARVRRRRPARPLWPMIVLRTPKGWTGPSEVDGQQVEGTWRAHQVPLAETRTNPAAPGSSSKTWLRSYRPEELFDAERRAAARVARAGTRRAPPDERQPARQRWPAAARSATCPTFTDYAVEVESPATTPPRPPGCSARSCAT